VLVSMRGGETFGEGRRGLEAGQGRGIAEND